MNTEPERYADRNLKAIALQDRFVRGLSWLRRIAGMTQQQVAEAAGWKQPYVDRLEDATSPLLKSLSRLERYARACKVTTVIAFVDPGTGQVVRTLPLDEAGEETALRLRESAEASAEVIEAEPAGASSGRMVLRAARRDLA